VINARVGAQPQQRIRNSTLANDIGASLATVDRGLKELEVAGLIHRKRTGRANIWTIHNEARTGAPVVQEPDLISHPRENRSLTGEVSTNKKNLDTKQSNSSALIREELSMASEPLLDPLEVEAFLESLPANLRPDHTSRLSKSLSEALRRGWTAVGLAQEIRKRITNPDARAGLTMKILGELAQQRASEHSIAATPTPTAWKDVAAAARCDHGEVVGRCALCRWAEQGLTNGERVSA
jgi:DNA-binding MarR family transcriptional regulator